MTRGVVSVSARASLWETNRIQETHGISCVLVEKEGEPIGVISRTDLLRAARRSAAGQDTLAPLRSITAGELSKKRPLTIEITQSISAAAALMVKERIHRLFVEEAGKIVGVISTHDVLKAIVAARVPTALFEVMSHPIFTIPTDASIAQATDRLAAAHVSGLTVVDADGWPVGYYSQTEALAAREALASTLVDEAMSCALVCLHEGAQLFRAAALARGSQARRVLVIRDKRAVGVLTPLDFARAVSA
jgi:CBS domain-containing protein